MYKVIQIYWEKLLVFTLLFLSLSTLTKAQFTVGGYVRNDKSAPVGFATVSITDMGLTTTTDNKGYFFFKNIAKGKYTLHFSYLGYVALDKSVDVQKDWTELSITLKADNLTQEEVMVTAKKSDGLTTTYNMDHAALEHMQLLNATDITSLIPGGKTSTSVTLTAAGVGSQTFYGNGFSNEMGNPSFGTGVEVDGVRISNNASGQSMIGPDTRNITTTNIESVEVVMGIPSIEYGDVTNGLVKIHSKKGVTPLTAQVLTQPKTKQFSLSKGFSPSSRMGIFNFSLEHTRSIADISSPYTSYSRNGLSVNYSNTFSRSTGMPILLEMGVSGNIGGYNSKSDPDLYVNTYSKLKDRTLRGSLSAKWLLQKKWITNIELQAGANINNRETEINSRKSASSSTAAVHTMQDGYRIGEAYVTGAALPDVVLIPSGYWYQTSINEDKLFNYSASLKARLVRKYGHVNNDFLVGGELTNSYNNGQGSYYKDLAYAPSWRPYPYNQLPGNKNYAIYAQNQSVVPFGQSRLTIRAGIRSDITDIKGSAYGTISNWSPRANASYTFFEGRKGTVRNLSLQVGWGKTVKQPSFSILYPQPNYYDYLSFAPGTTASGQTFYAYYTKVSNGIYNPDLQWQYNIQKEITLHTNIAGNNISITASEDKTYNSYISGSVYTPFTYKLTSQSALQNVAIPEADRNYVIDQNTGVVTVSDKTGKLSSVTLPYTEYTRAISSTQPLNGAPVLRRRLSWTVNFREIEPLKTELLLDGNYYYYKGVEYTSSVSYPSSSFMSDGSPYKYIGYYVGSSSYSNGSLSKSLNINLTATTHIPAIRMIVSARFEGTFYDLSQNLSQYSNGSQRGYVLDSRTDYTPSATQTNIYGGDRFVGVYPEYYTSLDDLNTMIPFKEKFLWAKDNDAALYNDLSKLVEKTNYDYSFNPNRLSFYYSANLAVTKEIGNIASLTFRAVNFINNLATVRSSWTGNVTTLFGSSLLPEFYYGLSLTLKL